MLAWPQHVLQRFDIWPTDFSSHSTPSLPLSALFQTWGSPYLVLEPANSLPGQDLCPCHALDRKQEPNKHQINRPTSHQTNAPWCFAQRAKQPALSSPALHGRSNRRAGQPSSRTDLHVDHRLRPRAEHAQRSLGTRPPVSAICACLTGSLQLGTGPWFS